LYSALCFHRSVSEGCQELLAQKMIGTWLKIIHLMEEIQPFTGGFSTILKIAGEPIALSGSAIDISDKVVRFMHRVNNHWISMKNNSERFPSNSSLILGVGM
jgi:hypothetical protein